MRRGDITILVTTYPIQHKAHKRYTACSECKNELHSPYHDMHHKIWELQQIAKLSNIQIADDDKSIIVESEYQGKKYRGVLYPLKDGKAEVQ